MKKVFNTTLMLLLFLSCNSDDSSSNPEEPENPAAETQYDVPANLADYYKEVNFSLSGEDFKDELATLTISKHTTFLEYWQRHNYLYRADQDPNNPSNVILIYSGESRDKREYESSNNPYNPQTFNTEHVYPQSKLQGEAVADLHILRVADKDINELRWNYPFTEGSGSYRLVGGNSFYPGDEWSGDVARMIMYMNLRYDEPFSDVGSLDLFLKWNAEDPVSGIEIQRNTVIQSAQGNRNPFIDNPHLASRIWGGEEAGNRWSGDVENQVIISEYVEGSSYNKALELANSAAESIELAGYSLMKITNGTGTWENEYQLTGTMEAGEVLVLVHSRAEPDLLNAADIQLEHQVINFNGNDPVGLFRNGILIDMIGYERDEDFAKDVTLRRKADIDVPNDTYVPDEWERLPVDTFDGLGSR